LSTKIPLSEADIKRAIEEFLAWQQNLGKLWFTRLNSGKAFVKKGDRFHKIQLCPAGTADLLVITNNGRYDAPNKFYAIPIFLELKSDKGETSKAQDKFAELVQKQGASYFLVKSVDEVREIIGG